MVTPPSPFAGLPVVPGAPFDVLVMGGGVSGSLAAIAAARAGARVLLVEQHSFLGGSLTAMGVGPMMSFHNKAGRQLVRGLPDEVVQRLRRRGASPGHIEDTTTYCSTVTPFESEQLKIELESMLVEAGGRILYHTQLAHVERSGERIDGVVVCNKAGLSRITAAVYVDASGDGDLCAASGVQFQRGRAADEAMQPMTMNLKVGGVDSAAVRDYALSRPANFLWEHGVEEGLQRLRQAPRLSLAGYLEEWAEARRAGEVDVPRDQVLLFETPTAGVFIINTARVQGLDATDPFQLSEAEMIGRRQCAEIFSFLRRRCRGFEGAYRIDASAKIGVRETRHVVGLYQLTDHDLVSQRRFPDPVAMGGYPIDIHSPDGVATHTRQPARALAYGIPLRCLLLAAPRNLVVVGRCLSATHEAAAAVRVTPIAMAIGHAGGVVAALAARAGVAPSELPYDAVRERLLADGAVLSADPS
jgi:hypothetical protein